MKNFSIKSIILGIGIGMIITSIMGIVYLAGMEPGQSLSKEQIVTLAEQYGMVEKPLIIDDNGNGQNGSGGGSGSAQNGSGSGQSSSVGSPSTTGQPGLQGNSSNVIIKIEQGDTSEKVAQKLVDAGLITDKQAFLKSLQEENAESRIKIGSFKISPGADIGQIIGIIAGK